jgi:hypothetical protein
MSLRIGDRETILFIGDSIAEAVYRALSRQAIAKAEKTRESF